MKVSVRRCIGYVLIVVGVLLFFDVEAYLRETPDWLMPVSVRTEQNISYLLIVFGVFTILAPVLARIVRDYAPGEVQRTDELQHESVEERRRVRLPLAGRRSALADRGIVGGALVLVLLIPAVMMMEWTLHPVASRGMYVRIPAAGRPFSPPSDSPIVVTLRREKDSTRFFLDGKEVRPESLQRELKARFATRPDWTVFVEGDENLSYYQVVSTADAIATIGGHPVLLTPSMRKEAGH